MKNNNNSNKALDHDISINSEVKLDENSPAYPKSRISIATSNSMSDGCPFPKLGDSELVLLLKKEVADLYLKIKRCSKDVSVTESHYYKYMETDEDKEERKMIYELDPRVILQYINVSIDVIINLKFEDIENKMMAKVNGSKE